MPHIKRNKLRYHPPLEDFCEVRFSPFGLSAPRYGLIHDQSHGGCSIMCVTEAELKQGDLVLLKLGTLHPMQARIVYLLPVAADVRLIGCEFLEEREQFLSEAAEPVQCGAAQ